MPKKRRLSLKFTRNLEGILFMAPWAIGFILFLAFPLVFSLYMSFNEIKILPTGMRYEFHGIQYYKEILLNSSAFYDQLIPYFQEVVIMIPIILIFSLLIAILLNQKLRGSMVFRAIFFLPVIFTTGYLLTEFVSQGEGSLGFLDRFSVEAILGDSSWSRSIQTILSRFVLVLWYSGVQILIFLAGRQTIASSAYESARIDGASPWEIFWKITLPAMAPFIFLNLIYTVVDMFTFPFNPILSLIDSKSYGYSSALVWIYFLIIVVFLLLIMAIYMFANRTKKSTNR